MAAAQEVLARNGRGDVSIQEITDLAGVAQGSFYNHFSSKEELFDAAIVAVMETSADVVEAVTADLTDPLEVYVVGIRFTGRLAGSMPTLRSLVVHTGLQYVTADIGLAPRARRDLELARASGRVTVEDIPRTQALVGGMVLGLFQYLDVTPEADPALAADDLARRVLIMLGLSTHEADELVARPLPHP